jgi:hypothetical protein
MAAMNVSGCSYPSAWYYCSSFALPDVDASITCSPPIGGQAGETGFSCCSPGPCTPIPNLPCFALNSLPYVCAGGANPELSMDAGVSCTAHSQQGQSYYCCSGG